MSITCVDSFLVRPSHGRPERTQTGGARLQHVGKLFAMLETLFDGAGADCNIDIAFRPGADGSQRNECKELLQAHLRRPSPTSSHDIAQRLASVTGNQSGLALLFVICGRFAHGHRLVLARFPAEQGVLAEEKSGSLSVEFIEKVFMKSAHAYKCATFTCPRTDAGFSRGSAVDKQINGPQELSLYWISKFLDSDLATTGAAGTRRLGNAMKQAVRDTDSDTIRGQLIAAAQLIPTHAGKKSTAAKLLSDVGVSADGIQAVENAMNRPELMNERFQLLADEFARAATYRTVELDNGALLLAETAQFDNVFRVQRVAEGRARYSTEGRVVSERLRKLK
jgi:hypothetical protein